LLDILQYLSQMRSPHLKNQSLSCALFALALLCSTISMAESLDSNVPNAASAEQSSSIIPPAIVDTSTIEKADTPVIDSSREYVSDKFVGFASGVDAFFGSDRNYQESNKSVLQFDLTRTFDSTVSNKVVPTFRAKFHLPALQNRMQSWLKNVHLLLESNPDQNLSGTAAGNTPTTGPGRVPLLKEVATPDSYGAALRIENNDEDIWRLSADAGLKLVGADDISKWNNTSIDPFVRTRGSVKELWGPVQLQLAQSFFWFNSIGPGEGTQLDADYRVSDPLLFRSTSSATWLRDNPNFNLHQDFSLYQTLTEHSSLLYQLAANGVSRPQAQVSEYIALLLYRQRFYRDWMFYELSPQLHYPRATDYQLNTRFMVRLEILFSK